MQPGWCKTNIFPYYKPIFILALHPYPPVSSTLPPPQMSSDLKRPLVTYMGHLAPVEGPSLPRPP